MRPRDEPSILDDPWELLGVSVLIGAGIFAGLMAVAWVAL